MTWLGVRETCFEFLIDFVDVYNRVFLQGMVKYNAI